MTITLPSRFARINRWIHTPSWGPLASHDVPFADGLSGTATLTITAKSPLLVGGVRRKATKTRRGEVWPFCLPDGTWALPPSGVQGLCRSILEIAGFGRLGRFIDDRRFGIRDLADSETALLHYRRRLADTQAGWLIKEGTRRVIVPCQFGRVHVDQLEVFRVAKYKERTGKDLVKLYSLRKGGTSAAARYSAFLSGLDGKQDLEQEFVKSGKEDAKATDLDPVLKSTDHDNVLLGSVVITGKIPVARGRGDMDAGAKQREFVFHSHHRSAVKQQLHDGSAFGLEIDPKVWEAFEYLHCDKNKEPQHEGWKYWAEDYEAGDPVPVFWWAVESKPDRVDTFGVAGAFKAAFQLSTHDMLRHSHPDHLPTGGAEWPDLPDLIFGWAAEHGKGLKRRAWFGTGLPEGTAATLVLHQGAILSSSKPGYYPTTVRQRSTSSNTIPAGEPMAAFSRAASGDRALTEPELAGVRVWPATGTREIYSVAPPDQQNVGAAGESVKTNLNTLPVGTVFTMPLTFHNLRPVELGGVLWALSFGDLRVFGLADLERRGRRLHHRLGMGKPFGFGEVQIDVALESGIDAAAMIKAFEAHMNRVYPKQNKWAQSPQVLALLKAADPAQNTISELEYMSMRQYQDAKKYQEYLGSFVSEQDEVGRDQAQAAPTMVTAPGTATPPVPTTKPVVPSDTLPSAAALPPRASQSASQPKEVTEHDGVKKGDCVRLKDTVKNKDKKNRTGRVLSIDPTRPNPYRLSVLKQPDWYFRKDFDVVDKGCN